MRRSALRVVLLAAALLFADWFAPAPTRAHPYIFITVKAEMLLDEQGRLEAVRSSMSMNETDSLYIASEYGLDPDGPLSAEQSKFLFELYAKQFAKWSWVTHVSRAGRAAPLSAPLIGSARMKDAVLTIDWTVPLKEPLQLSSAPILLQFFEPTFYAEAIVSEAPTVVGPGAERCDVAFTRFEPTAETKRLRLALSLVPPDVTPDDPMVGRRFADRTEVRCKDV